MSQNIVYKTYEINTDVEHYAKPINLSGASTVKLTDLPTGIKCWISTESTGENKFPLINRGDGWVNLPAPLYDLYVYTEGTTIDNQKILINYTGQNDFFTYGNNSSEIISKIGEISSLSTQAIKDVNDSIYNTYMKRVVARFVIRGSWNIIKESAWSRRFCHLPLGANGKISSLNLSNDKYYRITTVGHLDLGNGNLINMTSSEDEGSWIQSPLFATTVHFSIFSNVNGAKFSVPTSSTTGTGLVFDFENFYTIDKSPWGNSKYEFNLWGGKHKESSFCQQPFVMSTARGVVGGAVVLDSGVFNFDSNDLIISGQILNSYQNFGLFWKVTNNYSTSESDTYRIYTHASPNCHASLIVEVSEVLSA